MKKKQVAKKMTAAQSRAHARDDNKKFLSGREAKMSAGVAFWNKQGWDKKKGGINVYKHKNTDYK